MYINFIATVSLLILIDRSLGYGIITTLKNNLAGSVLSVFSHKNGVYYVGNFYQVRLINSTTHEDTVVVGTGACCYGGDGGPALRATMHWSFDVYVTSSGEIYFTEHESRRIRFVNSIGVISTVAGTGNEGYSAAATLAINANLWHPIGLVLDADENIFFSDLCVIRKITRSTGMISTIAGSSGSDCGYYGDGGLAINSKLYVAYFLDLDSVGNVIITDHHNQKIRKISKKTGIINTIVSGIGCRPIGVSVDRSTDDVYFSDSCSRVRRSSKKFNSDDYGTMALVAGGNGNGYSGDGESSNSAQIYQDVFQIDFVSSSPKRQFLIADNGNRAIRVVSNPCEEGGEYAFGDDCWCSGGYYSDNGRAPCNQCDYGSYSDSIGGSISNCKCQNGFYSSTGSSPCNACPEGTDSKIPVGATSCTCKAGYTGHGDEVPSNILEGTANFRGPSYTDLNNFYSTRSFSPPCNACPLNSGTWNALTSPTKLQEGQGNKCLCDPDTKSATGFGPCEPCAEGSGSVRLTRTCYNGIRYDVLDVQSHQMNKCFCKAGYYSPDGSGTDSGGNCMTCPLGKASHNKLIFFVGFVPGPQPDTGSYCHPYYAAYGIADPPLNSKCVCIRNYYKNSSVAVGSSGHVESSNDCIPCDEGSATTVYDGTSCTICDIGYYSPTGLTPCAKCPNGKSTSGYQQASCTVKTTVAPTPGPTPSPTPSSPSITDLPIAQPTRAPLQTKKPTAYPTIRPTQPNQCTQGYFSGTGFNPGCQACPLGTTNTNPGMTECDICDEGYVGMFGEPPCTECPESSISNEKRTICTLCIGFEPSCMPIGVGGSNTGVSLSNVTTRLMLLEKKIKAQQSFIERYKKQRDDVEL